MNPKDTRTEPQKIALYTLVETLLEKYNLTIDNVHCHNEFVNKACPSYSIKQFREEYNKWLEEQKLNNCNDCCSVGIPCECCSCDNC